MNKKCIDCSEFRKYPHSRCGSCIYKYRYPKQKEYQKIYMKNYRQKNKEKLKELSSTRYQKNIEQNRLKDRLRRQSNEDKQKKAIYDKRYRDINKLRLKEIKHIYLKSENGRKGRLKALLKYQKKRQQQMILATPKWINILEIDNFYQNCPEGKVVDHIIPILGKNVCGLHVPWNFQYLTPEENSHKGNR